MHRFTRVALLIATLIGGWFAQPERAMATPEEFAAGLALIAKDSFNDTSAGIDLIARSGSPHAAAIIEALSDRRLLVDAANQKIFYRDATGATRDALTNEIVATPPADVSTVRLNNRVRTAASAAIGALSLMNPDPARRIQAAQAVMKSRDAEALPVLETAIAAEKDPLVRTQLQLAWAAVTFVKKDSTEAKRLEAIALLDASGSRDALSILRTLPADTAGPARAAANTAIKSIEDRLALWGYLQNVWYGVSLGSVLLLAAIGLAITFGVMGVINMAHGEMVMLGAYTTFVVQDLIRTKAPWMFEFSLAIAIPLAFLVAGGVGVLIERGVIRYLYGRPLETLLATWGVSEQSRGRHASVHVRRHGTRRPRHHLEPTLYRHLCRRHLHWPFARAPLHATRPAHARGDAEPPHGILDGHSHRPRRCADIRPRLGHCRTSRRGAVSDR